VDSPPSITISRPAYGRNHGCVAVERGWDDGKTCANHLRVGRRNIGAATLGPGRLHGAIALLEKYGWIEPLPAAGRRKP